MTRIKPKYTSEAYNKLIAAAPELLSACKEAKIILAGIVEVGADKHTQTVFLNLSDAIAKAEGC